FYPDPTHLAIIIADVADKGIAASLYMMMSKTFLDTHLSVSLSPSAVLEEVNKQLHERSPKGMFVTVWLGVLDLRTGEMATSNAGHEYPVIKRKDGAFELIKDKHGFVLGGLKNTRFKEQIMQLNEGDILLVYTDGVPEATNKDGQMYGLDRMLDSLNGYTPSSMSDLVNHLKSDIDQFAKGVSQFDDTTIMALRMGARLGVDSNPEALQVKPVISELERIQEYISGLIDPAAEESKNLMKIHIAADEIFSNIVNHSDATFVKVQGQVIDNEMRLTFFDDGVPFDPLKQEAPDLVAEASKRKIGGLGIFITCKTMDDVAYQYENNMNQLTITKKL
ncbi:MAG: SpoIIE family protein phosphatase, partial [Clostridiales bacterium]|nr:SpoIIE family protein phosphatase [Candidatus Scatonaster coprocaballi]